MSNPAPSNGEPVPLAVTRSHREARNSLRSGVLEPNLMPFGTCCIIAPKIAESQDRIRLWKQGVRDLVMELCCALHNFRVRLTPWQPMI